MVVLVRSNIFVFLFVKLVEPNQFDILIKPFEYKYFDYEWNNTNMFKKMYHY